MSKKFNILLILLSIGLFQCAQNKKLSNELKKFKVQKIVLEPGMAKFISFKLPSDLESTDLFCKDKKIVFYQDKGQAHTYIGESYFSELKPYKCYFVRGAERILAFEIKVKPYKYREEKLRVDRKRVVLSKKDQQRAGKERVVLKKIYSESSLEPYFQGPFRKPLNSHITSHFGTRRVYNSIKKGQHLGIDFRAAVGVPLPNSNRGRIVYSGDLFYTGNTVIVDHGMSIFTIYAHMSEILVSNGDVVERGDVLGKAGKTGRVSGPHLHWGVKVQGDRVSGFSLINASEKQFGR